jgi:ubiquinone biosynthesis protein UbiJ
MKTLLEKAINRYLTLDPESPKRIASLNNKIVSLELSGILLTVQMLFVDKTIQLKWNDFLIPDLTIRGTPLNLLHLSLAPERRQHFFAEDVALEGNIELAEPVFAIFNELEIDWEEYISKWTGDVPAYQTSRFVRQIKKVGQRIRKTLVYNLNEYLHEEINAFPPLEALENFFHDVDNLRMDVDRLEVRIKKLEEML